MQIVEVLGGLPIDKVARRSGAMVCLAAPGPGNGNPHPMNKCMCSMLGDHGGDSSFEDSQHVTSGPVRPDIQTQATKFLQNGQVTGAQVLKPANNNKYRHWDARENQNKRQRLWVSENIPVQVPPGRPKPSCYRGFGMAGPAEIYR